MSTITASVTHFAHEHDDMPAFHAAFLVTTFLVAAVFPLGFFGLLILGHMALDLVKYSGRHGLPLSDTIAATLLESIVDISLFLLSLTFAVYFSHTFFLSAVSGMLRSELTILRAIGTLLPKVHIVEHMLSIVLQFHTYMENSVHSTSGFTLTRAQHWALNGSIACSALLAASFLLYHGNGDDLVRLFLHELRLSL